MLQVGLRARGVAISLVFLTCVFATLWVAIGASTHKDYETPTPVIFLLFFPILSSLLTPLVSVLVLDQPSVPGRAPGWRIHLAVDRTICLHNVVRPAVLLGGGFLVDR